MQVFIREDIRSEMSVFYQWRDSEKTAFFLSFFFHFKVLFGKHAHKTMSSLSFQLKYVTVWRWFQWKNMTFLQWHFKYLQKWYFRLVTDVGICNGNIKDLYEHHIFTLKFTFKLFHVSVAVANIGIWKSEILCAIP